MTEKIGKRILSEFIESYIEENTECDFCGDPAKYECFDFLFCDECCKEMIGGLKSPRPAENHPFVTQSYFRIENKNT